MGMRMLCSVSSPFIKKSLIKSVMGMCVDYSD